MSRPGTPRRFSSGVQRSETTMSGASADWIFTLSKGNVPSTGLRVKITPANGWACSQCTTLSINACSWFGTYKETDPPLPATKVCPVGMAFVEYLRHARKPFELSSASTLTLPETDENP